MKAKLLIIVLCAFSSLKAQPDYPTILQYKTWITSQYDSYVTKGILYEVKDSSLVIVNMNNNYNSSNHTFFEININDIKDIRLRRKNKVGNSCAHGALAGLALGVIIGLASGDDNEGLVSFSAEEKALIAGIPLAALGAIIGAISGSSKIHMNISGNMFYYNQHKEELVRYALKK